MLSLKNELSCATQKITEFAKQTKNVLGNQQRQMNSSSVCVVRKGWTKHHSPFLLASQERCNAITKDNSARLVEDSRTPQGLCLRSAIKKDPDWLQTALQEHLQLGQPESFPPGARPSGGCPALCLHALLALLPSPAHSRCHLFVDFRRTVLRRFSPVRLFVTLQTVTRQAALSMEFSRHEYWSGLSFLLHRGTGLCLIQSKTKCVLRHQQMT